MCLSSVGKIISVKNGRALVDFNGVRKEVSAALKPQAKKGLYALVHAGFIIEIMAAKEAKKTIADINETQNF
ncbi:MAG: HypC/HybG/HupF family hydrogenase formation chaperone [Elusimicrobiota bacterium]|jgi:hydrogenase expression/formation protein HypC|nr:HypC/HybG/HupF family hydrogenase formation chaperone [Elusimicrobiota bacterium]